MPIVSLAEKKEVTYTYNIDISLQHGDLLESSLQSSFIQFEEEGYWNLLNWYFQLHNVFIYQYLPNQPTSWRVVTDSFTSQIEELFRYLVDIWVAIPRPSEVREYLFLCPDIIHIVLIACKAARDIVGREPQLSLEIYSDPEIDYKYLVLYIRQESYSEDILDKIDRIRSRYVHYLAGTQGWFLVTTDFCSPKW